MLFVADSGPGVSEADRERVFDPFFTTKARGGGLGLPIARRTAELHGGSLVLDCPDSGGTVVTMRLPLRPAASDPNLGRKAANVGANVVRPDLP